MGQFCRAGVFLVEGKNTQYKLPFETVKLLKNEIKMLTKRPNCIFVFFSLELANAFPKTL